VLGVDQMPRVLNEEVMESTINLKLSSTQQHVLAQDLTREEIKHAMFSLKNNKATGPDGFNAGFFKRMWHIVGEDVINAVRSFFQTRWATISWHGKSFVNFSCKLSFAATVYHVWQERNARIFAGMSRTSNLVFN
jgi:hypothetical protein